MKQKTKNLLLAIATICAFYFVMTGIAFGLIRVNADSVFTMGKGAEIRVFESAEDSGIRFTAELSDYNAEENAEYGMLIIRNDWLTAWGITDNYVPAVQAKYDELAVNKDGDLSNDVAAPIKTATPYQSGSKWKVTGSLIDIREENFTREFFAVAYKKANETYTYAAVEASGDNIRSISNVAVGALLDDVAEENKTAEVVSCLERYAKGAKRSLDGAVEVGLPQNGDGDVTFKLKATSTAAEASSEITVTAYADETVAATDKINLNAESPLDGVFTVESELGTDGWYVVTINSELFNGQTVNKVALSCSDNYVIKDAAFITHVSHNITVKDSFVQLLTPKKLNSNEETGKNTYTPTVYDNNSEVARQKFKLELINNDWQINFWGYDDTVHAADRPTEQDIKVVTRYGTTTFSVRVSYPIYSANDLDFLSTISYYNNDDIIETYERTASHYLSASYIFMNDIDYAEHTRNYILPIASMTIGKNAGRWADNAMNYIINYGIGNNTASYYSASWKNILGLSEGGDDTTGRYLSNADGSKFAGINPNGLWFSGRIDGNGYAIKNAWYMWDNYLGNGFWKGESSSSNFLGAVHGSFVGLNSGTIENLELNVSAPNNMIKETEGKYSQYEEDLQDWQKVISTKTVTYKGKKILCADNSTVIEGYEYYSYGYQYYGNGSGAVVINCGTIKNVAYNVIAAGGSGNGGKTDVAGTLVIANMANISDCVINRFIKRVNDKGTTYEYALVGINLSEDLACIDNSYLNAKLGKGSVSGCYILVGSSAGNDLTVSTTYCSGGAYDCGSVDEGSKIVYSTVESILDGDYNSQLVANYTSMIAAANTNNNLSDDIWVIDSANNTVSLKKCIATIA